MLSNDHAKFQMTESRQGFTAIELLAATALAALLMVAVLGVLTSMAVGQKALFDRPVPTNWQSRLVGLMEKDLINARSLQQMPNGFQLAGWSGSDVASGLTVHRETTVGYEIVEIDQRPMLVRRETDINSASLNNVFTNLVCFDVRSIRLVEPEIVKTIGDSQGEPNGLLATTSLETEQASLSDGPLPDQVMLELIDSTETSNTLTHVFVLR